MKLPSQAGKKPYIMKLILQSSCLSRAGFAFPATPRRPPGHSITLDLSKRLLSMLNYSLALETSPVLGSQWWGIWRLGKRHSENSSNADFNESQGGQRSRGHLSQPLEDMGNRLGVPRTDSLLATPQHLSLKRETGFHCFQQLKGALGSPGA